MLCAHSRHHAACKPKGFGWGFGWRLKTEANIQQARFLFCQHKTSVERNRRASVPSCFQAPTCNRGGVATSSYSTKTPEQPARLLPPPRRETSRGTEPETLGKGGGNSKIVAWLEQRLQSSPDDRRQSPSKASR